MTIDVIVEIGAADDDSAVVVDQRCRELSEDLRLVPGIAVEPVRVDAAPGTKGIAEVIGTIAVSGVTLEALKVMRDIAVAYIGRSGTDSITMRSGDKEVVVQGRPSAKQEELVKRLFGELE